MLGASEKSKVPVRAPIVSAGSNSVSLPNLRPANNLVNPNWGRGNVKVVGGSNGKRNSNNRIRSLNASKIILCYKPKTIKNEATQCKKGTGPTTKMGNNFGIEISMGCKS